MSLSLSTANAGSMAWKGFNTLLAAAGTSMSATALGSKCDENKVREIFRQEMGNGRNGGGFNESIYVSSPCSANTGVNRFEMEQSQQISELTSARDVDTKILELYKASAQHEKEQDARFVELTKQLTDYIIENNRTLDKFECDTKLNAQANSYEQKILNQKVDDLGVNLNQKIDSGFANMFTYVNGAFQPVKTCTPLYGCVPVSFQGQIIDTTATGTTATVVSTARRNQ
jgi:hypothetical protein